jgi:hypothetical protein
MIKLNELNAANRCLLDALSDAEAQGVLDMATDVMLEVEKRHGGQGVGRARLGENGAVELVLRVVVFANASECQRS